MGDAIRRQAQAANRAIKVLDVGCGQGRLILYGPFSGVEFVGIDISRSSLQESLQRGYSE